MGILVLYLMLGWKNFSTLSMMVVGDFLINVFHILFCWLVLNHEMFKYVKCFLSISWDNNVFFPLILLMQCITFIFLVVEIYLHSWDKYHSVMVYTPSYTLLNSVTIILLKNFFSFYIQKSYWTITFFPFDILFHFLALKLG